MKKFLLVLACVLAIGTSAKADEGMWLLPYLQKLNAVEMKEKGLKIKVEDIHNPNGPSIKDAIVIFGRGCTGEIVSPDGLLFTNHHCGYGNIQSLSSTEHDYLKNGFWAMNRQEEIPVPGLSVYFVRSIKDVTDVATEGVTDSMTEAQRSAKISENVAALNATMKAENPGKMIEVKAYYGGNQYFATILEEYNDIRFVGAPPTSIGKFGGETDNWMWPRHTGDFSIFRVYSAPDGSPAAYSADNVPYKAPKHLTISAKGIKEGDFSMVMGFPGSTTRYMTTYEIDEMLEVSNPNRIYIRGERQSILKKEMEASDKIRIQYAAKYASSSNYWKNSIGKSKAIRQLGIRDLKKAQEDQFTAWAAADPSRERYTKALPLIARAQESSRTIGGYLQIMNETVMTSIEIGRMAAMGNNNLPKIVGDGPEMVSRFANAIYKDYDEATDKKVTRRMLEILIDRVPAEELPSFVATDINGRFGGDINAYVNWLYNVSIFANKEKMEAFAAEYDAEKLASDPALAIYNTTQERRRDIINRISEADYDVQEGHRLYVAGLMEMAPDVKRYPDANFTMRLTYGTVLPYQPADGVYYDYYTTLKGVMEKEDELNPTEFTVPARLKELYEAKDYGRYADYTGLTKKEIKKGAPGTLNTCFISTNDITGGNSGSPVLNAHGQLIGLAFDGNWEAMSGDVLFEHNLQRCINVDVRYVLFVIDKFAGAGHLLDEMTIEW